jgi:hypothetical protein
MKKYTKSSWFILTLVVALCPITTASQTTAPKPLDWHDFNAGDGGFSVKLPGTPKMDTPQFTIGSMTLTRHAYSVLAGNHSFEIDYMDLPAGSDPDGALEGGISNMINSAVARGASVLSQEAVSHGNCAAREVTLSTAEPGTSKRGFSDMLIIASGLRVFTVLYLSSADTKTTRDAGRTFIDSFTVTGGCTSMIAPVDAPRADKTEESLEGNPDPATGWRNIESGDLGVRMLMAGTVRHVIEKTRSAGVDLTHHTFLYSKEGSVYSGEVIGDYPPGWHTTPSSYQTTIDITLYSLRKNLGAIGFEITPVRDLRLGTNPGREFSLIDEARRLHGRMQIYVTLKRVYVFMAFTQSDNSLTQISQYFSSIRISPK